MNDFINKLTLVITTLVAIAIGSVLTGTIIWGTWDVIATFYSPLLQWLPADPAWWDCVKVSWFTGTVAGIFFSTFKSSK